MKSRIKTTQTFLRKQNATGFIVSSPSNIFYITGFKGLNPNEREVCALITTDECFLFVPPMYAEQARNSIRKDVILSVDTQHEGVLMMYASHVDDTAELFFEESDLKVSEFEEMRSQTRATWTGGGQFFSTLRIIKDEEELKHLAKAASITDSVFNDVIKYLSSINYETVSEMDIVDVMRTRYRVYGGESFGFDPIVACGTGSAEPHYHSSDKKLKKQNPLLLDFGITYKGYTADLTRTVYLGTAPDSFRAYYNIVHTCNTARIGEVKEGIHAGKLHSNAVAYFSSLRLAESFIHSLGHGVGIDIHEEPFFRTEGGSPLKNHMVITIEPGLYFPGEFGIRIEDLVIVTESGGTILSHNSSKELIEIR